MEGAWFAVPVLTRAQRVIGAGAAGSNAHVRQIDHMRPLCRRRPHAALGDRGRAPPADCGARRHYRARSATTPQDRGKAPPRRDHEVVTSPHPRGPRSASPDCGKASSLSRLPRATRHRKRLGVQRPAGSRCEVVPRRGLEPPRPFERQHLKLVRLPIPPSGHGVGGAWCGAGAVLSMVARARRWGCARAIGGVRRRVLRGRGRWRGGGRPAPAR